MSTINPEQCLGRFASNHAFDPAINWKSSPANRTALSTLLDIKAVSFFSMLSTLVSTPTSSLLATYLSESLHLVVGLLLIHFKPQLSFPSRALN
jgi:hypothetical protein